MFHVYWYILWYCTLYCLIMHKRFYGLYIFYHNYLTIFLFTNNIDKKHLIYMLSISCCGFFLKLTDVFRDIINFLKVLSKGFWLDRFYHSFLTTWLYIINLNKKYLPYASITFYNYYYLSCNNAVTLVIITLD